MGRFAEAEAAYAQALTPEDGYGWYNRAVNVLQWAQADRKASHTGNAAYLCEMAGTYAVEAARLAPSDPDVLHLLTAIRGERARLGV